MKYIVQLTDCDFNDSFIVIYCNQLVQTNKDTISIDLSSIIHFDNHIIVNIKEEYDKRINKLQTNT